MCQRCEFCGEITAPGESVEDVPIQMRHCVHPLRPKAFKHKILDPRTGRKRTEYRNDPGGEGLQIVKTAKCCIRCLKLRERNSGDRETILENLHQSPQED